MRKIPRRGEGTRLQGDHDTKGIPDILLPQGYDDKLALLNPYVEKNYDLIARPFYLDGGLKLQACSFYFNAVVDNNTLNEHIFRPLMMHRGGFEANNYNNTERIDLIVRTAINVGQVYKTDNQAEMVHSLFDGMLILIFESIAEAIIIDIHGGPVRAIEEPPAEKITYGPREGFIENLDINIATVRRRLRNPRLVIKRTVVGRRTRTPVAVLYIDDIADHGLLEQLHKRLNRIDIDGALDAGTIIQFIEDKPYSPFPQIWISERPDKTVAELLEGRIAVMVGGTPSVIFLPALFIEFFQASEDYLDRTYISSLLRFMRYLSFIIAVSLPALYIALISFTPQLLPTDLVVSLAQARREVPFPVLIEILILEFIIQMVIESGLRLPGPVGQTAGVVSGIILGQAAISAKLASPAVIIIIAVSTICTFALPSGPLVQSARILRLPLIFITAVFGLFGFSLGWLFILAHLCSLESLGIPYFAPFAPVHYKDLKDSFFRTWLWKMNLRPLSIPSQQKRRQGIIGSKEKNGE